MINEKKNYVHFLIAFIIVLLVNLIIKNMFLDFICAAIFLVISLRSILKLSNKEIEVNREIRRQGLIYNGIVFAISIVWLLFSIIMLLVVGALIQVIKGIILWIAASIN